jgi:hypothetical protein
MEETGSTGELIRLFLALSFNELSTQKANTSMYFLQASFAKEREGLRYKIGCTFY